MPRQSPNNPLAVVCLRVGLNGIYHPRHAERAGTRSFLLPTTVMSSWHQRDSIVLWSTRRESRMRRRTAERWTAVPWLADGALFLSSASRWPRTLLRPSSSTSSAFRRHCRGGCPAPPLLRAVRLISLVSSPSSSAGLAAPSSLVRRGGLPPPRIAHHLCRRAPLTLPPSARRRRAAGARRPCAPSGPARSQSRSRAPRPPARAARCSA